MSIVCYVPIMLSVSVGIGAATFPITWCVCAWTSGGTILDNSTLLFSWLAAKVAGILAISHIIAHSYCYSSPNLESIKNQNFQCPESSLPKYSYCENSNIQSIEWIGQKYE